MGVGTMISVNWSYQYNADGAKGKYWLCARRIAGRRSSRWQVMWPIAAKKKEKSMDEKQIVRIFEAFFEKYKKTEGDRTSWSAHWTVYTSGRSFEINMTKCPRGTRFKIFCDKAKVAEIEGWEAFLGSLDQLEKTHAPAFDRTDFFTQMEDML
jgi:hypothetical protein